MQILLNEPVYTRGLQKGDVLQGFRKKQECHIHEARIVYFMVANPQEEVNTRRALVQYPLHQDVTNRGPFLLREQTYMRVEGAKRY